MNGRAIGDRRRLLGRDPRRREQGVRQQQAHVTGPPGAAGGPVAAVHEAAAHV